MVGTLLQNMPVNKEIIKIYFVQLFLITLAGAVDSGLEKSKYFFEFQIPQNAVAMK